MSQETEGMNKYLEDLKTDDLLLKFSWDEWLEVEPPYPEVKFSIEDVWVRFQRNGYDWDIHGSLYTPEKEVMEDRAFVIFHGGAGSEKIMDLNIPLEISSRWPNFYGLCLTYVLSLAVR